MPSECSELGDRGESLACCHRDGCLTSNPSHLFRGVGDGRLFEPQRIELLKLAGQTDCSGCGELAVRTEQEVGSIADGLTNRSGDSYRSAEVVEARHVAVECGVRPGRVELHRIEPAAYLEGCLVGGLRRVAVDVGPFGIGVEVGIGARRVVNTSAEQIADRLAGVLADNVPAGDLDTAHDADKRRIGAQGIATRIDLPPEQFDPIRVGVDDPALGDVVDHRRHGVRPDSSNIDLAVADHARIGCELDDDEILATEVRGPIPDDERGAVSDLHPATLPEILRDMTGA